MPKLLGFSSTQQGGTSSDQTIRILEKSYLNRTKYGEFNTTQEVDGLLTSLKALPQTPDVMEKVADLENKKLQISAKLGDILSEKNVFDTDLQSALDLSAKTNYKNSQSLIGSYASIYADAASRYDSEVMAKIAERYGTSGTIPPETLAYRKTLNEKAKFLSNLANAYYNPNTAGNFNTNGVAVKIDTNPTNGSINRIDIVPSSEVDGKTHMRTDVELNVNPNLPDKKLPIYLRTNDVGVSADGKTLRGSQLGGISYQEKMNTSDSGNDTSGGVLQATKLKDGFFGNPFSDSPTEKINKSIDSIKTSGISLDSAAYKYDSQDIPNDNVLKLGSRLFYSTGKDGQILEIKGKDSSSKQDNLTRYLQGIGKNPNTSPYFITKEYLTAPDGNSRIQGTVDENYFNPQTVPQTQTSATVPQSFPSLSETTSSPSFFSRVNRPNKPDQATVASGTQTSTPDLLDKGMSFFRSKFQ